MSKYETLEQELIDILSSAKIEDNKVYLTCGQLPRDKYLVLDDCLKRFGGKWNRKGYHEFVTDPKFGIQAIIETGFMPVNNPFAYHKSPAALCEEIVSQARVGSLNEGSLILEPSAGQGAISDKIIEANPNVKLHLVELDPINYKILSIKYSHNENVLIWNQDFLDFESDFRYDIVIMNPPFSVEGDKDAYITHVKHAWSQLNDKGILVSIVNGGWETKTQKKYVEFREWLSDKLYKYEYIPENTFESTSISTRIIELRKDNSDSLKKHNGFKNHNQYEFVLYVDNEQETYDLWWNLNIPIEVVEERLRNILIRNEYRIFIPLSKKDLLDIQEHRVNYIKRETINESD